MIYDIIVVGGGYAGMAAALHLARARRSVLMLDKGLRRNRFAERSHGFLTRMCAPPLDRAGLSIFLAQTYAGAERASGSPKFLGIHPAGSHLGRQLSC